MVRLGAAIGALALPCMVVAYLSREAEVFGIYGVNVREGNRADLEVPLVDSPGFLSGLDPSDRLIWIGAAVALALAGLVVIVAGLRSAARPSKAWIAAGIGLVLICCVVIFVNRDGRTPGASTEEGWTYYAPISDDRVGLFDAIEFWDPYLWFGGAVALALVAGVLAISGRHLARR